MSQRSVVLVGPMGSGKSSVGRALAQRLSVGHVDTDDMAAEVAGKSIPEIFASDGEAVFRDYETAALERALASGCVVSTGGGVVVGEHNRELLQQSSALVVWLDASIDTLERRVGSGRGRPLLEGDVRSALQAKIAERAPGYLEVADLRVDTTEMRHIDCVEAIVAALEGATA